MKIAVTGITGFIGKNLIQTLANSENQYICLIRNTSDITGLEQADNITFRETDFWSSELVSELRGIDAVIHMIGRMGGYGIPVDSFKDINLRLTENMVNACILAQVKQFIYLSTPGVQGFGKRLCREEEPYAPRNAYEQTKADAEKMIIKKLTESDVKYTILRPDFVYGPEDIRRIKMYKNICSKKFVLTTSGKSYLHPTYVMDVVQGIMRTVGNPRAYNEIFNISAENDITVNDYLDTIASYFNTSLIHINIGYKASVFLAGAVEKFCNMVLKREGFVTKNKIDFLALDHSTSCNKAEEMLYYRAEYTFKEGFAETMRWYREKGMI